MSKTNQTEVEKLRIDFWNKFSKYLSAHDSKIEFRIPNEKSYINTDIGKTNIYLSARINFKKEDKLQALIDLPSDKIAFNKLKEEQAQIEKEFGRDLLWELANTRWNIRLINHCDPYDSGKWETYFQWLMENLEKMDQVFRSRIQAL